ncbi:hypothetical protein AB0M29_41715 [Streptomyces sp. NPDC051976]|uniref:hypothetical protein n=1 Tax=Streptomyces sp. NPDC051976 TaxID=3154947 RepID=UPI003429050F
MIYSDAWLDRRLKDLDQQAVTALAHVLEIEAGLQEVLLDARHRRAIAELADVLDIEAGLAAALATQSPEARRTRRAKLPAAPGPAAAARTLIAAIPPEQRLILRAHPASSAVINTVNSSHALANALEHARSLSHVLKGDRDREQARAHARNLAIDHALDADRALVRALDRVVERDFGRGSHLDNILHLSRDRDRALARSLIRALDHALSRAFNHALDADRDLELIRRLTRNAFEFESDLVFRLGSIRSRVLTRALDRALDQSLSFARDFARDFARHTARGTPGHSAHALDRAFKRAHENTELDDSRAIDHALDRVIDYMQDLSDAHQRSTASHPHPSLVEVCARILDETLAGQYNLAAVQDALGEVLAQGAFDDVTDADLRHTDLTSFDLTGLRWTRHSTRWPDHIDPAQLLTRSRETAPDSGIYTITQGPVTTCNTAVRT